MSKGSLKSARDGSYSQIWLTGEDRKAIEFMKALDREAGGPGSKAQVFRNMLLWLRGERDRIEAEGKA